MFICHDCCDKHYVVDSFWKIFGPQSRGPCEDCGKTAVCLDMPSSSFTPKKVDKPKPENKPESPIH